jgi:hypothetical protein
MAKSSWVLPVAFAVGMNAPKGFLRRRIDRGEMDLRGPEDVALTE